MPASSKPPPPATGLSKRPRPPIGRSLEQMFQQPPILTVRQTQLLVLVGVPLFVVLGLFTRQTSVVGVAIIIGAISLLMVMANMYSGNTSLRHSFFTPAKAMAIVVSAYVLVTLLRSRFFSSIALVLVTILLFWWRSRRVVQYFNVSGDVSDEKRRDFSGLGFRVTGRPRLWPLMAVLLIVAYVPLAHSNTLAIFSVGVVIVASLFIEAARADEGPIRYLLQAWPRFNRLRNEFLRPAGRWENDAAVHADASQRQFTYLCLAVSAMLTLTIGLSFCCPWELFAHCFAPSFKWVLAPDMPYVSFGWFAPFRPPHDASIGYWGNVLIGIPLLFALPELLLLAVFAPTLRGGANATNSAEMDSPVRAGPNEWERHVNETATSQRILELDDDGQVLKTEAEHLFLGLRSGTNERVLLDRAILREHVYIVGQTGSGKTALGIMPLLIQLIRGHLQPETDRDKRTTGRWEPAPPAPIMILDLKGDLALFNTARLEAEKAQRTFLFFSADGRKVTHRFDPFVSIYAETRTPIEVCELLIQAMNLFHGEQYGASYYSRQHRDLLLTVIAELHKAGKKITSWDELYQLVKMRFDKRRFRDAVDLLTVIHALTFYDQLTLKGRTNDSEPVIHMPDVLQKRQIVYFWLPSLLVNMSVREIAKLALYTYLTAASDYNGSLEEGQRPLQSYVIIDEFQRIAAENLSVILQQVRTAYVSLILANQDPSDLKLPDIDLRSTVKTNTRMKQYFTVTDPREIEELTLLSGEEIDYLQTETVDVSKQLHFEDGLILTSRTGHSIGEKHSEGRKEYVRTRLQMNDIIEMNNLPQESLIHIVRDAGLTRLGGMPTRVLSPWPLGRREYERRHLLPWPRRPSEPSTGQLVPAQSPADIDRIRQELKEKNDLAIEVLKAAQKDEQSDTKPDWANLGSSGKPNQKKPKAKRNRPTQKERRARRAEGGKKTDQDSTDAEDPHDAHEP